MKNDGEGGFMKEKEEQQSNAQRQLRNYHQFAAPNFKLTRVVPEEACEE